MELTILPRPISAALFQKRCLVRAALETISSLNRFLKLFLRCVPFNKIQSIKKKWYFSKRLFFSDQVNVLWQNVYQKLTKRLQIKRKCSLLVYSRTIFNFFWALFLKRCDRFLLLRHLQLSPLCKSKFRIRLRPCTKKKTSRTERK